MVCLQLNVSDTNIASHKNIPNKMTVVEMCLLVNDVYKLVLISTIIWSYLHV